MAELVVADLVRQFEVAQRPRLVFRELPSRVLPADLLVDLLLLAVRKRLVLVQFHLCIESRRVIDCLAVAVLTVFTGPVGAVALGQRDLLSDLLHGLFRALQVFETLLLPVGQRLRVLHDLQDVLRHSALFHVESDLGLGRVLANVKLVHVVARFAIDHSLLEELPLTVLF